MDLLTGSPLQRVVRSISGAGLVKAVHLALPLLILCFGAPVLAGPGTTAGDIPGLVSRGFIYEQPLLLCLEHGSHDGYDANLPKDKICRWNHCGQ